MCRARIEKSEGCNHMTCYYCEFQFCWLCGGTYTSDHFVMLNPFGCGGLQFGSFLGSSRASHMIWIYVKRFFLLILILLLSPIALVLAPPILLCVFLIETCNRRENRIMNASWPMKFLILILLALAFAVGLASDVIIVPLAVVIGIPFAIGWQIYSRYQIHKKAKDRLK